MNFSLSFEYSPFLLIPALVIGAGLSLLLYKNDERLNKTTRIALFTTRFILFTLLFILLINPIIKHFENRIEKPSFVIALDNSASIGSFLDSEARTKLNENLDMLKEESLSRDMNLEIVNLDNQVVDINDSLNFESEKTDISKLLKNIDKRYENRNLSGILLISDGLFNRGISPLFSQYSNRISTLGVGDTSAIDDVWINDVQYNEVAFLDNNFPVKVSIQQNGFENKNLNVQIINQGNVILERSINFKKGESLKIIDFKILAKNKGQQRYRVKVTAQNEDIKRLSNNVRDIYLEVIDGRDKVLILSLNPHPDIKAIKEALSKSMNYDIRTVIISTENVPDEKFDLVIMHQIPNLQNSGNSYLRNFIDKQVPIWFILGPSSDLYTLNREFKGIKINSRLRQMDEVNPLLNPDFKKFKLPDNLNQLLTNLPPVKVPFARYHLGEGSETVLFQSVSNINTGKPLLAIQQSANNKYGILVGDGLWSWRMHEYSINDNFEFTDALINKMVQYLSLKEDKRKFRMRLKNEKNLYEGSPVIFEAEVYNDIFEPVHGNEINLNIRNENSETTEYSFVNIQNRNFDITGLDPGIYNYTASTTVDKEKYEIKGQFSIRKMELESLSSQANFDLLRAIAERNNGSFFYEINSDNINGVFGDKSQGVIHSREVNIDIISLFWLFFIGLLLVSIEWFTRKYSGAY